MRKAKLFTFLSLVLVVCLVVGAAMASEPITDQQWENLTADKAFGYKDARETQKMPVSKQDQNLISQLFAWLVAFFSSPYGKTTVWILLFAFIAFVLYQILKGKRTLLFAKTARKTVQQPAAEDPQPEDMLHTDWENYLTQAMREGNKRFAIRYSFMRLLQLLQQERYIDYRADKTNYDYYYELHNDRIKRPFRQLTLQYEYAWYGQQQVEDAAFQAYMDSFRTLQKQIRPQ
jgi:hypothetical protein